MTRTLMLSELLRPLLRFGWGVGVLMALGEEAAIGDPISSASDTSSADSRESGFIIETDSTSDE